MSQHCVEITIVGGAQKEYKENYDLLRRFKLGRGHGLY